MQRKYRIEEWRGKKYNHLTITGYAKKQFICMCDCGRETRVNPSFVIKGTVKTCGDHECEFHKQVMHTVGVKHGKYNSPVYKRWQGMKDRCYNPNSTHYKNYGGRGIKICDEWKNDFPAFEKWAMENGFKKELSIDRIDVNGDYCPENCRWVDAKTQAANKRIKLVYYDIDGVQDTISGWSKRTGVATGTLRKRMLRGMTMREAITNTWEKVTPVFTYTGPHKGENCVDIFKKILKEKGIKQTEVAKKLGISKQARGARLKYRSLTVNVAKQMFDAVGYKIVVVPMDRETKPGGYEI